MDVNTTTITFSSIILLVGIVLSISAFVKNNKKDIQVKATDYAILKEQVKLHEQTISEMKMEIKANERELRNEIKRFDELLIKKVDDINSKIDDLKNLLIEKMK